MAERPDRPDTVEWVPNGTVRLFIDNDLITLRRPKVGELRKLRELVWETDRAIEAQTESVRLEALDSVKDKPDAVQAATDAGYDGRRTIQEFVDDQRGDWIEEAVGMLGNHALPPARDDWPTFLLTPEFASKLLAHWRSVP